MISPMKARRTNSKDRILDETARLVQQKGFRSTHISDVLQATGLQKGGLYHHFDTKETVGLAVLERERRRFYDFLDEALAGENAAESLDSFLCAAFSKHWKSGFKGGCFFGNTALEMADEPGPFAEAVGQIFDEWTARLERVIARGQTDGTIRNGFNAPFLAGQIIAVLEGGIMLSRLAKKPEPLRDSILFLRRILFTNPPAGKVCP